MGTRHLIAVYKDGDPKIAQYGQWDGYPDYQGVRVLRFLRANGALSLKHRIDGCEFLSSDQLEKVDMRMSPQFSRNLGAGILNLVASGPDAGVFLQNHIDFAADGLFCEWAYVIDLDTSKFEVYRGFNRDPAAEGRFSNMKPESDGYTPVSLVAEWSLDRLPTEEEFLSTFGEDEQEGAA